jgi:hypothetical protein
VRVALLAATRRTIRNAAYNPGATATDRGDMTGDGVVNFDDINPFVAILGGGA